MCREIIKSIDRPKDIELSDGDLIFFHQRWLREVQFRKLNEGDEVVFRIIPDRGDRVRRTSTCIGSNGK